MSQFPETTGRFSVVPQSPWRSAILPRRIQITDGQLSLVARGFGQIEEASQARRIQGGRRIRGTALRADGLSQPGQNRSITYPLNGGEALASAAPDPVRKRCNEYFLRATRFGQYASR